MSDCCIITAPTQCIKLEYANALFFLLYVTRAFYRRVHGARFALLVPQSVNFTIGITFLANEKRQVLNNTSAGCTRIGYQPL